MDILLTVMIGATGGLLLWKAKVPGGMLVGAVLGVAVLNVSTGHAYLWPQARVLAQILTGAYIGCMMTREAFGKLPQIIKPYLMAMSTLFVLNLTVGLFIYRVTDLDLLTSFLCAVPGGMTDTPLIALDMGADSSSVAVMQFVRMLFGIGCLPVIIQFTAPPPSNEGISTADSGAKSAKAGRKHEASLLPFLPTLFFAAVAGIIGRMSGVPAGTLAFSLILVSILRVSGKTPPMPLYLRRAAQLISGCCIGCTITAEQLRRFQQLILPAIVICAAYCLACVGVGSLMSKVFHIERREAMLYMTPAGAAEMTLIAADLGIESTNLAILQICRMVGVVLFFPQIFRLIAVVLS